MRAIVYANEDRTVDCNSSGDDFMGEFSNDQPKEKELSDPGEPKDTLPSRFARLAATHPFRTAIGSGIWQPTYLELDETANCVAQALLRHEGAAGDRVALLMRHDAPLIAGMLAILRAAKIVVVLNPADPPIRLRHLVEESDVRVILADSENLEMAGHIAAETCNLICFENASSAQSTHSAALEIAPTDIASLVYTSGTLGRPKAVILTHQQMVQIALRYVVSIEAVPNDRIALFASLSGAAGMYMTWCALLTGATLCPFPATEKGLSGLTQWLTDSAITVYSSATSLFRQFARNLSDETKFPLMRVLRLGSEKTTSWEFEAYKKHFPEGCMFIHALNSSEAGNIANWRPSRHDAVPRGDLPVGTAAEGVEISLLDEYGRPVGSGTIGEIIVRSRYMSAGYWRDPGLTAKRFVMSSAADGTRTFRSGDLGRFNSDGMLEFVGRVDDQVKIRGYRVGVSEVERVLLGLPGVDSVVVDTRRSPNGEPMLVAYVVLRETDPPSGGTLRRMLRARLPSHMVPSTFVFLATIPLTPHGKIDRQTLREIQATEREQEGGYPPRTETESLLGRLWGQALDRSQVFREDDFFDLGGDFLIASEISARVNAALGIELNLSMFTNYPTLVGLAGLIDGLSAEGTASTPQIVRSPRRNGLPLAFIQERMWKDCQTTKGSAGYVLTRTYRILGPLDREILRECMSFLAARHEPLRTTFPVVEGETVQIVHPPTPTELPFLDLVSIPNPEKEALHAVEKAATATFDLANGPLLRFLLIRIRSGEHWLMHSCHHIIGDAWSSSVYFQELGLLYEAKLYQTSPPLPVVEPLQFGDYAAWERSVLRRSGAIYKRSIAWWKNVLAGAPRVLTLPFKRSHILTGINPKEGVIRWGIGPETSLRLAELARKESTTYYVVRLAVFAMLLWSETNETDVVFGTIMTNRNRVELQKMLGIFSNLVTLRFHCESRSTFREWLYAVRRRTVETESHSQIPYEALRHDLSEQGVTPPDIQVIFNVNRHHVPFHFADLELVARETQMGVMPWGITVVLDEHQEEHHCRVMFDAGMYRPSGMRRIHRPLPATP